MRKAMYMFIAIALLVSIAIPAQAARIDDLQARYNRLVNDRRSINNALSRLEGAIGERQAIEAEMEAIAVEPEVVPEVVEVKEEVE